jgi:hypothetical protein
MQAPAVDHTPCDGLLPHLVNSFDRFDRHGNGLLWNERLHMGRVIQHYLCELLI